jgi:uncharacterized protein YjbI with pentapeptide repeats
MGKIAGWYRRLRGQGPLAPIGLAIGGMLALALGIAAAVTITGLHFLHFREFQPEPQLSAATLYDLLKISFAVAAGIGGVVALVTAYRRQRVAEFAQDLARQQHELAGRSEEREATRLLNERFTTAAGQLGADQPAVRLAGVYAMAGLADDWPQQRQTCVDVLCAYLRMPYEPDPGEDAPPPARQAFQALREVRHTVIRVITAHLQPDTTRTATAQDWRGLNLDFTGTILDGGNFRGTQFTGGTVSFRGTWFTGEISFDGAEFSGSTVDFFGAQFTGGGVSFGRAEFSGGTVNFGRAEFSGGGVIFGGTKFSGGTVNFDSAKFSGTIIFIFDNAEFSGGTVSFRGAQFSGGTVSFRSAHFSGGTVDFREPGDWSAPPQMPPWTTPPPGVLLPTGQH